MKILLVLLLAATAKAGDMQQGGSGNVSRLFVSSVAAGGQAIAGTSPYVAIVGSTITMTGVAAGSRALIGIELMVRSDSQNACYVRVFVNGATLLTYNDDRPAGDTGTNHPLGQSGIWTGALNAGTNIIYLAGAAGGTCTYHGESAMFVSALEVTAP